MEDLKGPLITVTSLKQDFGQLGVQPGMTVLLHSSFKSLGSWVAGGPSAVILALEQILGEEGTLVMPTHTAGLSDPAGWMNPPAPQEWWDTIRREMPPYDPHLTPLWGMGIIPETFRHQRGVMHSGHPLHSFAAWGRHAGMVTREHELAYSLGEQSPLSAVYKLNGYVLLLGVGNGNNTSLHLAEHRAAFPGRIGVTARAPMKVEEGTSWVEFPDWEWSSDDFADLAEDFQRDTGRIVYGKVAGADAQLIPQREIVDYGVKWLEKHRAER